MKKNLFILLSLIFSVVSSQAETLTKWHDINKVVVNQKVDVNASKIYLYAHSTAQRKNDNNVEKQNAALNALPEMMAASMKEAYPKATVVIIDSPSKAGSDGLLIDASLISIDWGSGATRAFVPGAGGMKGTYKVSVSNGNGLVYEMENTRYQSTVFTSAKGAAVIKAFNKALVEDFIEATNALVKEGK